MTTDRSYTGQTDVSGVGLYYYGARWYDTLTHFVQPDSIIPNPYDPLDWNRYAYARYNPIKYTDPTGHMAIADGPNNDKFSRYKVEQYKPTIWISGYTEVMLEEYLQHQSGNDDCAPYSIAMAVNLKYSNSQYVSGSEMEKFAESKFRKIPGFGMRPNWQRATLEDFLPGTDVEYSNVLSPEAIVESLKQGDQIIVSVSWGGLYPPDTITTIKKGVGHAMVLVGYDTAKDEYRFLDPGQISGIYTIARADFNNLWINQPNIFIPSQSAVIIHK